MIDESVEEKQKKIREDSMFFLACIDNKPIGPSKHFQMHGICENLIEMTSDIPSKEDLWKKLHSFVNLELLEEKNEEEKDEKGKSHDSWLNTAEDFKLSEDLAECVSDEAENPKMEVKEDEDAGSKTSNKPIKDYTRNRTPKSKSKEDDLDLKTESGVDSDEDTPLKPPKPSRRSLANTKKATPSSRKAPKRRGLRDMEKDASPSSTSSKKTDEDAPISSKKLNTSKRSLRSRGDDDCSSPTHTPPPNTRSRRI